MNAKIHAILDTLRHNLSDCAWFIGVVLLHRVRNRVQNSIFGTRPLEVQEALINNNKEVKMELNKDLSHELKVHVAFSKGVAEVSGTYVGKDGLEVTLSAKVPDHMYFQKLKAMIPGNVDDAIIDIAEPIINNL